jgi:cytochrome c oxidase assembly protein subunit 15
MAQSGSAHAWGAWGRRFESYYSDHLDFLQTATDLTRRLWRLSRYMPSMTETRSKSVEYWLLFMMFLVAAMIVVGGATRLTNSGLSITEWAPIRGALPPLSTEAWMAEFEKYKLIPEFEAEHPGMDLEGFKFIYFWEWGHRQLGRFIGLAYTLPLFFFLLRGKLTSGHRWKFFSVALLIGMQGAVGWWMVHSGLQEGMVSVSQYRLATHLGIAFIILGVLYWLYKRQSSNWDRAPSMLGRGRTKLLASLVYLQIIGGAFMAGTYSGHTYNEWPLMDGDFIPQGYGIQTPFWRNIFENSAAIQFNHRTLAYILLVVAIWVGWSMRRSRAVQPAMVVFFAVLLWQVGLGIWTLLAVAPLNLSLLHQFSSIFVFLAVIGVNWRSRYTVK